MTTPSWGPVWQNLYNKIYTFLFAYSITVIWQGWAGHVNTKTEHALPYIISLLLADIYPGVSSEYLLESYIFKLEEQHTWLLPKEWNPIVI